MSLSTKLKNWTPFTPTPTPTSSSSPPATQPVFAPSTPPPSSSSHRPSSATSSATTTDHSHSYSTQPTGNQNYLSKAELKKRRKQLNKFLKQETAATFGPKPTMKLKLPDECAFDFFELMKKLGHNSDGDTVAWLLKSAETPIQRLIGKQELQDNKKEETSKSNDLKVFLRNYEVNQVWAVWDNEVDGMPRSYVRIEKILLEELKVEVCYLKARAYTDIEKEWLCRKKLPMACGKFRVATVTSVMEVSDFSYRVDLGGGSSNRISTKEGETWVDIVPRDGEIWAVFRDWNADWTCWDFAHARYELVEVVPEFSSEDYDMMVMGLTRVGEFEGVFERDFSRWRQYKGKQLLEFSHRIPATKLKVGEIEGVSNEAWKLNPAAIPAHLI